MRSSYLVPFDEEHKKKFKSADVKRKDLVQALKEANAKVVVNFK